MRLAAAVVATAFTVSCRTVAVDTARLVPLDEPFVLSVGQSAVIDRANLHVHFVQVRGDSRCPSDVTCVWAGDATVVAYTTRASVVDTLQLHTGIDPRSAPAGEFTIALEGLEPIPRSDREIRPGDYSATFRVTR